jgi:hypothetical protein
MKNPDRAVDLLSACRMWVELARETYLQACSDAVGRIGREALTTQAVCNPNEIIDLGESSDASDAVFR